MLLATLRPFLIPHSLPPGPPAPLSVGAAEMLRDFAAQCAAERDASRPRCSCGCPLYTPGPVCTTCLADRDRAAERCWAVVAFALRCGPVIAVLAVARAS